MNAQTDVLCDIIADDGIMQLIELSKYKMRVFKNNEREENLGFV